MRGAYLKTPYQTTRSSSNLKTQKIQSQYFHIDPTIQFKQKYASYGLTSFVEDGLTTWEKLIAIGNRNQPCIEALKELHVTTALGVENRYFAPPEKITIEELEKLDSKTLEEIIGCRSSDEVIAKVREWQSNNPNLTALDEEKILN